MSEIVSSLLGVRVFFSFSNVSFTRPTHRNDHSVFALVATRKAKPQKVERQFSCCAAAIRGNHRKRRTWGSFKSRWIVRMHYRRCPKHRTHRYHSTHARERWPKKNAINKNINYGLLNAHLCDQRTQSAIACRCHNAIWCLSVPSNTKPSLVFFRATSFFAFNIVLQPMWINNVEKVQDASPSLIVWYKTACKQNAWNYSGRTGTRCFHWVLRFDFCQTPHSKCHEKIGSQRKWWDVHQTNAFETFVSCKTQYT